MMTKQAELKQKAYQSGLKSRALSILIYLIDRSNKDLTCFPAIPTMAEQLHISVSTVKRALHELVDAGFVKKDARFRDKNRGQTSNLYTLVQPENVPAPKSNATPPAADAPESEKQPSEVRHITFADITACKKAEEAAPVAEPVKAAPISTVRKSKSIFPPFADSHVQGPFFKLDTYLSLDNLGREKAESQRLCSISHTMWTGVGVNLQSP